MPKLHNVHFPTRDKNILHQVYTNIPGAYKATLSPHLGLSDHISIEMIPSYRPLFAEHNLVLKRSKSGVTRRFHSCRTALRIQNGNCLHRALTWSIVHPFWPI